MANGWDHEIQLRISWIFEFAPRGLFFSKWKQRREKKEEQGFDVLVWVESQVPTIATVGDLDPLPAVWTNQGQFLLLRPLAWQALICLNRFSWLDETGIRFSRPVFVLFFALGKLPKRVQIPSWGMGIGQVGSGQVILILYPPHLSYNPFQFPNPSLRGLISCH